MKIAYFTDTFLPKIDGISTSLVTITSALASVGHEILIFAPRPKNIKEITWNTPRVYLGLLRSMPSFFYPDFRAATPLSPKLIMQIRSFKPDIIHFQTTFLVGAGGVLLGKALRKPIIGSFHANFMEPEYLKIIKITYQTELFSSILWKYALAFYNQCDAILAHSEETKKELRKHGVKRPVYVLPNSIDVKKMKKSPKENVEELRGKLSLNAKVLLYVGRISAEKSLDVLMKSFAKILSTRQDVSLLIIGDGPHLNATKKLANELGISKHVVFTGKISPGELLTKGYYQLADAFVTPSTSEVQPVSLIEAMYFGLPIVGKAKRGVGEMIKGVGLLSRPENEANFTKNILRILSDKNLREILSKQSIKRYEEKYKVENVVKEYEKLYEIVIKNYK